MTSSSSSRSSSSTRSQPSQPAQPHQSRHASIRQTCPSKSLVSRHDKGLLELLRTRPPQSLRGTGLQLYQVLPPLAQLPLRASASMKSTHCSPASHLPTTRTCHLYPPMRCLLQHLPDFFLALLPGPFPQPLRAPRTTIPWLVSSALSMLWSNRRPGLVNFLQHPPSRHRVQQSQGFPHPRLAPSHLRPYRVPQFKASWVVRLCRPMPLSRPRSLPTLVATCQEQAAQHPRLLLRQGHLCPSLLPRVRQGPQ